MALPFLFGYCMVSKAQSGLVSTPQHCHHLVQKLHTYQWGKSLEVKPTIKCKGNIAAISYKTLCMERLLPQKWPS